MDALGVSARVVAVDRASGKRASQGRSELIDVNRQHQSANPLSLSLSLCLPEDGGCVFVNMTLTTSKYREESKEQ